MTIRIKPSLKKISKKCLKFTNAQQLNSLEFLQYCIASSKTSEKSSGVSVIRKGEIILLQYYIKFTLRIAQFEFIFYVLSYVEYQKQYKVNNVTIEMFM